MERPRNIDAAQWAAFEAFVTTGEASEEFLSKLAENPELQRFADQAFAEKVAEFKAQSATLQSLSPAQVVLEIGDRLAAMDERGQREQLDQLKSKAAQNPDAARAIARLVEATAGH